MNLLRIDFQELYRRHLCRHSQFGINVLHLVAVAVIYLSLFGIAFALPGAPWTVAAILSLYFLLLLANVPLRAWLATVAAIGLLAAAFLALPSVSLWIYVAMIVAMHRFQVWHHRVYDRSHPMNAFKDKYRKGPLLFVLLAVYELPILLNYLVLDRGNWRLYEANGPIARNPQLEAAEERRPEPQESREVAHSIHE